MCRALYAQANELKVFLEKIVDSKVSLVLVYIKFMCLNEFSFFLECYINEWQR